ncbi:MAG: hypothetical protein A3H91_12215 [Gammaproteobacteria bacterium RIFCSPLOWO2_02_FULL_61_13]|nr:MAG: hypothetical protein A3H91_12215 [Gammaproteobacteria bacterium RIFCSPLOWO2_02_FULL_61_13]
MVFLNAWRLLWAIATFLVCVGVSAQSLCKIPNEKAPNDWCIQRKSEIAIIFVHGIISDNRSAWLHKSDEGSAYWPTLVSEDPDFRDASIFLAGYYSGVAAADYGISDAARDLFEDLSRTSKPSVMGKKHIIFVAHSLGGIVIRYMLDQQREQFRDKTVGLVLIASPGKGSEWADRLEHLNNIFPNTRLLKELTSKNSILNDLDRRFTRLRTERLIPRLSGRDYFENHFVLPGCWVINCRPIVSRESSPAYFGEKILIPESDHMSIVKPANRANRIFVELKNYYLGDFANTVRSGRVPNEVTYGYSVIDAEDSGLVRRTEKDWDAQKIQEMIDAAPNLSLNKTIIRFKPDPSADYSLVANELTLRGGAKIITNGAQVRFLVRKLTVLDGEILVADR